MKLAHECFRRALSADPAHQPAWVCEARVAEIIGETAEAVDMYRHATELEYSVCLVVCLHCLLVLLMCICLSYLYDYLLVMFACFCLLLCLFL